MHRILAFGVSAFFVLSAAASAAQPSALKELYGKGVHAFFAEKYEDSLALLSDAVEGGSKDPRCRYFRGLALLRTGKEAEANEDFSAGAALEMDDTDRFYAVSKSLSRMQGAERVAIEKHRTKARFEAYKRAQQLRLLKERGIRDAASEVELQPAPADTVQPVAPAPSIPGTKPEAEAEPDPKEEMPVEEPAPEEPAEEPAKEEPATEEPAEEPAEEEPAAVPGDAKTEESEDESSEDESDEGSESADEDSEEETEDKAEEAEGN